MRSVNPTARQPSHIVQALAKRAIDAIRQSHHDVVVYTTFCIIVSSGTQPLAVLPLEEHAGAAREQRRSERPDSECIPAVISCQCCGFPTVAAVPSDHRGRKAW